MPEIPGLPSGEVTIADLFRVLSGLQSGQAQIATRLEVIGEWNRRSDELHRDYEARLRYLERGWAKLLGAAGAVGVAAGGAAGWVTSLLHH